jgi:hypothetical protein
MTRGAADALDKVLKIDVDQIRGGDLAKYLMKALCSVPAHIRLSVYDVRKRVFETFEEDLKPGNAEEQRIVFDFEKVTGRDGDRVSRVENSEGKCCISCCAGKTFFVGQTNHRRQAGRFDVDSL